MYKRWVTKQLLNNIGLKWPRYSRCYGRFLLALLAGVFILWLLHDWLPPFSLEIKFSWGLLLSLLIWQPLIEEILFRGIIQGQLGIREWGKRSWLSISFANVVTTALFVAIHMLHSPPLFALTVFVPSLVFGYFRDYCNSVYPAIFLHSAYNTMVFVALIINGNMTIPVLQ